ncbi:sugar phosphate isomerase/epimerase family protein [Lactovum odontotermitis]
MYEKLAAEKRYAAIETRLIKDKMPRDKFNQIAQKSSWDITLWLTGEMGREGLSLSSLESQKLDASIDTFFRLLDLASDQDCQHIGLASGPIEDDQRKNDQIQIFSDSIEKIADYIARKNYSFDLLLEPLDEFAHKKNVIGALPSVEKLLQLLNIDSRKFHLCFDTAHSALNEDNLLTSVKTLAPYVSRIHFADAVLDKENAEYGDNHRAFDQQGIMNSAYADGVLQLFSRYSREDHLFVASEVRTAKREEAWANEEEYYNFVKAVIAPFNSDAGTI